LIWVKIIILPIASWKHHSYSKTNKPITSAKIILSKRGKKKGKGRRINQNFLVCFPEQRHGTPHVIPPPNGHSFAGCPWPSFSSISLYYWFKGELRR